MGSCRPYAGKIFGIGLNKTGTTTLGACLQALGYRHHSYSGRLLGEVVLGAYQNLSIVVQQHDSFEDWPFPLVYRYLDVKYPGSKFILTARSAPERWLRSLKAHALRTVPPDPSRGIVSLRSLAYGFEYPHQNEEAHLCFYRHHNAAVREYFRDRPDQLLEVCWERDASWGSLCAFLGHAEPALGFPHERRSRPPAPERLAANLRRLRALGVACVDQSP